MYINISIPLQLTRFYNTLIPTALLKHQLNLNYEFESLGPYIIINAHEFISRLANLNNNLGNDYYFTKEGLSNFELNLEFEYEYLDYDRDGYGVDPLTGLRFSILDDSLLNSGSLDPWNLNVSFVEEKSRVAKLWPITDNLQRSISFGSGSNYLEQYALEWPTERSIVTKDAPPAYSSNDEKSGYWKLAKTPSAGTRTGGGNVLFENGIYYSTTRFFATQQSSTQLLPTILKPFTPPALHDTLTLHRSKQFQLAHLLFSGIDASRHSKKILEDSKNIKFLLEFNNAALYFPKVELDFIINLTGIRYYMYFTTSQSGIIFLAHCQNESSRNIH
ncbi:unnamed protein product [Ambrosiozyma monospora]|uniref:Unnamed protein product n=1 Tax=Ambrosiozyma monospora TaxID=43982 RepID=A0A9W6T1U9_AMBMO|nr:unnamed protein product [Ambrosiozyma monospora]